METGLSALATVFLLAPAAFYLIAVPQLVEASLAQRHAGTWVALGLLFAASPFIARWTLRHLFELWGARWSYVAADGTRWGQVNALFGRVVAGEGVCLTGFRPTEAGRTPLSSTDAIGAGALSVSANLSRLRGRLGRSAHTPFDALMLAALVGLTARGSATISRARMLRWRKDWLRRTERAAPEETFTLERGRALEDGGEVERRILGALQAAEDRLAPAPPEAAQPGYRASAARSRAVRLPLDADLLGPAFATAAAALGTPACGGAPVAIAAAIDDFARRDPQRMAYLCGLIAAHRPR